MNRGAVVVMTTVADAEQAARLAGVLLEERLAACVQEIPITAHFRWQGAVRHEPEVLLLVKTAPDRAAAAVARLAVAHPYEVPEILALDAALGAAPYLAWLTAETRPGGTGG